MIEKKYKNALVLGRFQMLHKGHEEIINEAINQAQNVLVFIGSSDKSNTFDNPFTYEKRCEMLKAVFDDKIIIKPLPDLGVGNVFKWGDYVLDNALKYLDSVNLIVEGIESKCELWFSDEIKKSLDFIKVDRSIIDISATKLREYLYNNEYTLWKNWVNPKLYKYYNELRLELIKINTLPSKGKIILIDEE